MKVAFVGIGNMGVAVMCAALSKGLKCVAIDIDENKVKETLAGHCVVPEKDAEKILTEALADNRLDATTNISEIKNCDLTFIGVQTPVIDLICKYDALERVMVSICLHAPKGHTVFCGSTVFPGSIDKHVLNILRDHQREDIHFIYHPVFLRAGFGIEDYKNPAKVIVGVKDPANPPGIILEFFKQVINYPDAMKTCTYYEAEWVKMVHNQFMCTKITFVNEINLLCQEYLVDSEKVIDLAFNEIPETRKLLTQSHMKPGAPYSGPCLPKDTSYMKGLVMKSFYKPVLEEGILCAAKSSNENYRKLLVDNTINLCKRYKSGLGIIGVAFRSDFNEMRHSLAIDFIKAVHQNEICWMGFDRAFENISKEDYVLACRGETYLESLHPHIGHSFDYVITNCNVLFINCRLTDDQIKKIKGNGNKVIDIYKNSGL